MESSFVINSHLRCTSFGLKRNQVLSQSIASDSLVRELCRHNGILLEEAEAVILKLKEHFLEYPILAGLVEANGTIIAIWGDPVLQSTLSSLQFQVGANWREERMGTNAIGCALVEASPVRVDGEEHFFQSLSGLSASAAPVFDSQRRITAVFSIVSRIEDAFRLSLPFAILGCDSIQSRLQFRDLKSNRSSSTSGLTTRYSSGKVAQQSKILFQDIYSNCPIMDKALELARKSVSIEENILLTGESGTGKEMIAQAIHNTSNRKNEPFLFVSASSIQDLGSGRLMAAQENSFIEKILEANRGTIYLDEITDLNERSSILLTRLILEKRVIPYGDSRSISVDVRIISSTSKSIQRIIKEKLIRKDLLYRLKGIQIDIPSLRERSDIVGLSKYFLKILDCPEYTIDSSAQRKLLTHHWSGNIRELQGVILQAAFMAEKGEINSSHIHILDEPSVKWDTKYKLSAKDAEKKAILEALDDAKGNISKASEILGLGRTTLYRKFREYNISA